MSLRHLCWDLRAEAMLKIVVDVFNRQHVRQLVTDGRAVFHRNGAFFGRVGSSEIDIYAQDPALAPFDFNELVAQATDSLGD